MSRSIDKSKVIITFVGVKQARKDLVFLHENPSDKCRECEYYKVCIGNLEVGRVYKIVNVRKKIFQCPLHEGGVRVVEVVENEVSAAIPQKMALEGAVIVFHRESCGDITCENRELCFPIGVYEGDRCEIVSLGGKVECKIGEPLRIVKLRRVPS